MRKAYIVFLVITLCTNLKLKAQGDKDTTLESALELSIEELMTTKVSIGTKTEKKLTETPAIVSVFTAEQIKNMGARDLRDVLRVIPGFQLGMRDMGYTTIGVRGISTPNSEKIMIMIDGVPVNENLEGSASVVFADMVLENVEKIEVIRGPGSALYGANAFLGVINIISKKAKDINSILLTGKGGSFNSFEGNINAGKDFNGFKISGNLNYLNTDGAKQKVEIDALTNDPENSVFSLAGTEKGYTKLFRKKLTSSLNVEYNGFYSNSLFIYAKKGDYIGSVSAITDNSEAKHFQVKQMIGKRHKFSEQLDININAVYLMYSVDNLLNLYPDGYATVFTKGLYYEMGGKQRNTNFNGQLNYRIKPNNTLQIGGSYAYIKYFDEIFKINSPGSGIEGLEDAPSFFNQDALIREIGSAYIQDNWELNNKVSITAGIRLDNYSDAGSTVNPRAALVFNPTDRINVKCLYGSAYRAATFAETYLNVEGNISGDKNIAPETINSYEIYFAFIPHETVSVSVNYFYNSITNLITLKPEQGLAVGKYGNSKDIVAIQGFESEVKVMFDSPNRYAYITLTYQKGENKETGENVIGMANYTAFAGFNYRFSNGWNTILYLNNVGKRIRSELDIRKDLKGYTLLNVSLMKHGLLKNLDLKLSGFNLLNSDCRVPDNTGLIFNDYPLEGINFLAEISYRF